MSLNFSDQYSHGHPWLSALLGDAEIAALLSAEAELAAMLRFESALAEAQGRLGIISGEAARACMAAIASFRPDIADLAQGTERDGVAVPALMAQIREAIATEHRAALHFGATSQDVVDTALILRLAAIIPVIELRLADISSELERLDGDIGTRKLLGHTRMQPAVEITWHDRLVAWLAPLRRHQHRLQELKLRLLVIQLGGAVGTRDRFGDKGSALVSAMAEALGLGDSPLAWHNARDNLAELANWLSLVTGGLGKIGQDMVLLAQAGSVSFKSGGQSSAMPHKNNPIAAEMLVTLARFNATQLAGMHHALIHEQERSGAAWTLEWMILPQMLITTGTALRYGRRVLQDLVIS
jgi:3-carboxy-cis,cis-muconate cycloisomerase